MPPAFTFPNRETQMWMPFRFAADAYDDRNNNYLQAIGKLKPRVSIEQARGVTPNDPAAFGAAVMLALAMTIAGSLVPAIRALGADAVTVIRAQ